MLSRDGRTTGSGDPGRVPVASPHARIGVRSFERLLRVIIGVFGVLYALQTLDSYLADRASTSGPAAAALQALVLLSVLAGLAAAVLPRRSRAVSGAAFALFALAAAIWPVAIDRPVPSSPMPWLVALAPAGLAYLVVAARRPLLPLLGGLAVGAWCALVLATAGGQAVADAATDGGFVVAVTSVLVLLVTGVRRSLAKADAAQHAVLSAYEQGRLDGALEAERVRTDAFVHDSVLMTLLGAAGAHDPAAEALVARMAGNALAVLDDVRSAAGAGRRVPFGRVLAAADPELLALTKRIDFQADGVDDLMLPEHIAEAMVAATFEAIVNSLRHAGAEARRRAVFEVVGIDGLRVIVEDDGVGFDPATIPPDRGVRTAVLNRVHDVAGRVLIDSAPGRGTRVEISYGTFFNAEIDPVRAGRVIS